MPDPNPLPTISGVAEAILYVDDLDAAVRFYTDVLRLPLTYRFTDACFLQTGRHSTLIVFDRQALRERTSIIPAHGATGPGHVALAIPAADYDAWRRRLVAHGVEIEHEQIWSQQTRSIYFRDPDGNSLEFIEATHYPSVWSQHGLDAEDATGG